MQLWQLLRYPVQRCIRCGCCEDPASNCAAVRECTAGSSLESSDACEAGDLNLRAYHADPVSQPCDVCHHRHGRDHVACVLLCVLQQMRLLNIDQTLQGLLAANTQQDHQQQQQQQQQQQLSTAAVRHKIQNR
jgi:hypothetical protein